MFQPQEGSEGLIHVQDSFLAIRDDHPIGNALKDRFQLRGMFGHLPLQTSALGLIARNAHRPDDGSLRIAQGPPGHAERHLAPVGRVQAIVRGVHTGEDLPTQQTRRGQVLRQQGVALLIARGIADGALLPGEGGKLRVRLKP